MTRAENLNTFRAPSARYPDAIFPNGEQLTVSLRTDTARRFSIPAHLKGRRIFQLSVFYMSAFCRAIFDLLIKHFFFIERTEPR